MRAVGLALSLCALLVDGTLISRGIRGRFAKFFPLFYAYLIYDFTTTAGVYLVYWIAPSIHATVYWFCYVLSIVVEFAVLVEISDHTFRRFPALRSMGRALAIVISGALGLSYVLPAILHSPRMGKALVDFALRTSLTKAVILVVLFLAVRHFGVRLGRNVAGLMLGFSIYLAVNIANFAIYERVGEPYDPILWVASPIAYLFCVVVWTVALWRFAPSDVGRSQPPTLGSNSENVGFVLVRFNNTLSRFLHK
jgi:hypothetical protein